MNRPLTSRATRVAAAFAAALALAACSTTDAGGSPDLDATTSPKPEASSTPSGQPASHPKNVLEQFTHPEAPTPDEAEMALLAEAGRVRLLDTHVTLIPPSNFTATGPGDTLNGFEGPADSTLFVLEPASWQAADLGRADPEDFTEFGSQDFKEVHDYTHPGEPDARLITGTQYLDGNRFDVRVLQVERAGIAIAIIGMWPRDAFVVGERITEAMDTVRLTESIEFSPPPYDLELGRFERSTFASGAFYEIPGEPASGRVLVLAERFIKDMRQDGLGAYLTSSTVFTSAKVLAVSDTTLDGVAAMRARASVTFDGEPASVIAYAVTGATAPVVILVILPDEDAPDDEATRLVESMRFH